MADEKFSVNQLLKDSLEEVKKAKIDNLKENGTIWKDRFSSAVPINEGTGRSYSGDNELVLNLGLDQQGSSDPRFYTMKEIQNQGLKIKKGSKSYKSFYYNNYDKNLKKEYSLADAKVEAQRLNISMDTYFKTYIVKNWKYSNIFNGRDIEGLSEYQKTNSPKEEELQKYLRAYANDDKYSIKQEKLDSLAGLALGDKSNEYHSLLTGIALQEGKEKLKENSIQVNTLIAELYSLSKVEEFGFMVDSLKEREKLIIKEQSVVLSDEEMKTVLKGVDLMEGFFQKQIEQDKTKAKIQEFTYRDALKAINISLKEAYEKKGLDVFCTKKEYEEILTKVLNDEEKRLENAGLLDQKMGEKEFNLFIKNKSESVLENIVDSFEKKKEANSLEKLNANLERIKEGIETKLIELSPKPEIKDIQVVEVNGRNKILVEYDKRNILDRVHKEDSVNKVIEDLNKISYQGNLGIETEIVGISAANGGIKKYIEKIKEQEKINEQRKIFETEKEQKVSPREEKVKETVTIEKPTLEEPQLSSEELWKETNELEKIKENLVHYKLALESKSKANLKVMSSFEDKMMRALVATNKNTSPDIIQKLSEDKEFIVRYSVAENTDRAPILDSLSKDKDQRVRLAVASNEKTSTPTLERLSKDQDENVLRALSMNPNTPAPILGDLSKSKDIFTRFFVASNPNTSQEVLVSLQKDENEFVRSQVDLNKNKLRKEVPLGQKMLDNLRLAKDRNLQQEKGLEK